MARDDVVGALLARLSGDTVDHERFVGPPIDIAGLSPLELGRLWPAIRRASGLTDALPPAKAAAAAITRQAAEAGLVPALDEESGVELFRALWPRQWELAIEHLGYLVGKPSTLLQAELRRILGDVASWRDYGGFDAYQALALARWADAADRVAELRALLLERHADAPLRIGEFDVLQQVSLTTVLVVAHSRAYLFRAEGEIATDPAGALADEAAYVAFAQETLEAAARRVDYIRSGRVKYEADGAFTTHDAQVIARAARVAAQRDDPWFGPLILSLLPGVAVAPTAARTLPSQSLAIALGHAIEAIPTPESVRALREALAVVRHAGVEKKLARNLKPAERALGARPEVALRLAATAKPDRKQQAMLATTLEAAFWQGLDLARDEWRDRLADTPGGAPFARGLVWLATVPGAAPVGFMLDAKAAAPAIVDSAGRPVAFPESCRVGLWHPLRADEDERRAWQARIAAQRIVQPIRQVFREHYRPPPEERTADALDMFEGHELSIRPLIGLARKEGWQVDKERGLMRRFGSVRATFAVGAYLYPGAEGHAPSQDLRFQLQKGSRWCSVPIDELDPVVVSEACRAVDLLVSVTGFAVEDGTSELPLTAFDVGMRMAGEGAAEEAALHPRVRRSRRLQHLADMPLGEMARMRREALRLVLAEHIAAGRVTVGEHHVQVGACAVHLATARVTENGAAVELDLPAARGKLAALPWLPYDEVLLQKVADSVGALLVRPVAP